MLRSSLFAVAFALTPIATHADVLRSISVSGSSELTVAPDMATLRLGVETQSRDAQTALSENAKAVEAVLNELKANGIAQEQMQTFELTLNPVYSYDQPNGEPPVFAGYTAANLISVTSTDLARLGTLIALANEAGANRIQGLSFGLKDKATVLNQARISAVDDARARAALYAQAAGVELGTLLTLSETGTGFNEPPVYLQAMEMRSVKSDVPISAGEITITASVEVTYGIK